MVKSDKEKKANQNSNAAATTQADTPTGKEASLSPPPLNFGKATEPETKPAEEKEKQQEPGKEKEKGEKQDDNNFDIDFDLLPPELKLKIFEMGLDADVKGVSVSHKAKAFSTKFNFEYKGKASLNMDHGDLNHTMGYDIGAKNLTYGGKYQDWNWGSNYNFSDNSFGLSVGYGAGLQPSREQMANDFGNKMRAGFEGAEGAIGSLGSAFDDPVKYAQDNQDNIKAITKAVSAARKISKMKDKTEFGAGLRLGYSQQGGLSIFVGAQMRF